MRFAFLSLIALGVDAAVLANSSLTQVATASPTGKVCCYVQPQAVGLGEWYNATVTATVATVVTQYIHYNNTVLTTSTTYYNESATNTGALDMPTSIINDALYGATEVVFGDTTVAASSVILASPTPFMYITSVIYGHGIETVDPNGSTGCDISLDPTIDPSATKFAPDLIYLPSTSTFWTIVQFVGIDQSFATVIESQLEARGTTLADELATCNLLGGEGAPTLHVPVSALTDHTETTIFKGGIFTPSAGSPPPNSAPQTSAAPVPTASPASSPSPLPQMTSKPQQPGPSASQSKPANSNQPLPPASSANPAPTQTPNGNPPSSPQAPTNPAPSRPPNGNPQSAPQAPSNPPDPPTPSNPPNPSNPPTPPNPPNLPSTITIGSDTIPISIPTTRAGGSPPVVVFPGSTTLHPGSAITSNGQTISLEPSGTNIVVIGPTGTSTIPLAPTNPPANPGAVGTITIGTAPFTVLPATASGGGIVLPNGATLAPGSTTVVDGTTLSLAPSGTAVVVGSSTIPLANPAAAAVTSVIGGTTTTLANGQLTVEGGTTLTLPASGQLVLTSISGGSTTVIGGTTSVSGGTTSTLPNGSVTVIGGLTTVIGGTTSVSGGSTVLITTTSSGGAGDDITSGLGGGSPTGAPTGEAIATGFAMRQLPFGDGWLGTGVVIGAFLQQVLM